MAFPIRPVCTMRFFQKDFPKDCREVHKVRKNQEENYVFRGSQEKS